MRSRDVEHVGVNGNTRPTQGQAPPNPPLQPTSGGDKHLEARLQRVPFAAEQQCVRSRIRMCRPDTNVSRAVQPLSDSLIVSRRAGRGHRRGAFR